ncbi:MAG: ABC transporter permease [Methanobacteriota archaeon]|nr:MAG: ABC transporter permease [Euryarchaeota archaeon]
MFRLTLRRMMRNRNAVLGLGIVTTVSLLAIAAPIIAPKEDSSFQRFRLLPSPTQQDLSNTQERGVIFSLIGNTYSYVRVLVSGESGDVDISKGLDSEHLLGTDHLGRDILSRIVWGAQISLLVGVVSQAIACLIGVPLGAISGYYGGKIDHLVMRLADIMFSFPFLLFAIVMVAVLGDTCVGRAWGGLLLVFLVLGVIGWAPKARLVRASVLSIKEEEYVEAARAMGASNTRIIVSHILPNCLSPIIVHTSLAMASAILVEAALSFFGLGVSPPTVTWGSMLASARQYMRTAPHMFMAPGLAITITVFGFNLLGDGLRDAIDPRLKK